MMNGWMELGEPGMPNIPLDAEVEVRFSNGRFKNGFPREFNWGDNIPVGDMICAWRYANIPASDESLARMKAHTDSVRRRHNVAVMLSTDSKARKDVPIATGVLDYFPDAIAAVAELSKIANEKHNPGEPLHWSREKSNDHPDCLARHFLERGTFDAGWAPRKVRHSTQVAWRALAILQLEIEAGRE